MSTVQVGLQDAIECPQCGHRFTREMSAQDVARLESLILDKICSLEYVSKAGYSDDGREVTILVIRDDDDRVSEMIRGIGNGGTAIEHEMRGRMFTPISIHDGPDLPEGIFIGRKVVYTRETER